MIKRYADHAANERTFLAWVRTALATVGFGFVGSRLSGAVPDRWADAAILGAGGLVVALAYARMLVIRARIDGAETETDDAAPADLLLVALVLAFFGLLGVFAIRLNT